MFYVKDKFSFYHIPKTAGSSFTEQILNKYQEDFFEPSSLMWMKHHHVHRPIKFWIDNFIIDVNLPIYSICRNPYERMMSWFLYLKFHPEPLKRIKHDKEHVDYINSLSFEDFLLGKYKGKFNSETSYFIKTRDWNVTDSQFYYFKDFDIDKVKFMKIEKPKLIEQEFDIDLTTTIRNRVSRIDKEYREKLWTDNCVDLIRQLYSDDFEYFGYSKDFTCR